jgi:glutamyl-Q tRNA(Asp) synthetase
MSIVTRFAPSPTGYLHLGHAHAALTAHRLAREAGGRFLLRIEDIDPIRCRPDFAAAIAEDLRWRPTCPNTARRWTHWPPAA